MYFLSGVFSSFSINVSTLVSFIFNEFISSGASVLFSLFSLFSLYCVLSFFSLFLFILLFNLKNIVLLFEYLSTLGSYVLFL